MKRRCCINLVATVAFVTLGSLPLGGAEPGKAGKKGTARAADSRYVTPSAIASITGYLPEFTPVANGSMSVDFSGKYKLIRQYGQKDAKAFNFESGTLDIAFSGGTCKTFETQICTDGPENTVKTDLQFQGEFNTATRWTLESIIKDRPEARLMEQGSWDGSFMTVKAKS